MPPLSTSLFLVSAGALIVWLLVFGAVLVTSRPRSAPGGPATDVLGTERPAVVNLLTHRWRGDSDAVRATLVDLASRGILEFCHSRVDLTQTAVLIREPDPPHLTQYERRLLARLRMLARPASSPRTGDFVPPSGLAGATKTGAAAPGGLSAPSPREWSGGVTPLSRLGFQSRRRAATWLARFHADVAADARARRVARTGVNTDFLAGLAILPALPLASWTYLEAPSDKPLSATAVCVAVCVGLLRLSALARDRHQPTPTGRAAASHWLGVRRHLQEHCEDLASVTLGAVPSPSRLLAYAVALGLTPAIGNQIALHAGDFSRAEQADRDTTPAPDAAPAADGL